MESTRNRGCLCDFLELSILQLPACLFIYLFGILFCVSTPLECHRWPNCEDRKSLESWFFLRQSPRTDGWYLSSWRHQLYYSISKCHISDHMLPCNFQRNICDWESRLCYCQSSLRSTLYPFYKVLKLNYRFSHILTNRGLFLEGSWDGIKYVFDIDFSVLATAKVWYKAFNQVVFQMGTSKSFFDCPHIRSDRSFG